MKVTVLISVYIKENPEYLRECLLSLLSQTKVPDEIVVVKDGLLTKELNEILEEFSSNNIFKIIGYETNKGLGLALRYGLDFCTGDLIARMDSDDICESRRIEKEYNYLINHPEVKIVGSNCLEFIGEIKNVISKRIMPETNEDIIAYSHTRNPFVHPSIMTYRNTILEAGSYRDYYLCEDYDLWVRILKNPKNKAYNIQENLVFMRVSNDFYKRRGGLKYCRAIISFKKELYKSGYIKYLDYFKTKYATLFVSLMPGFLRELVYKKLLRKN